MYRSEGLFIPPLWSADPIHCRGCCSPASPGWFWASPSCSVFLCTGEKQSRDALQEEEGSLTLQVCGIQPQMSPGLALKPALVGPTVIRRLILQSCTLPCDTMWWNASQRPLQSTHQLLAYFCNSWLCQMLAGKWPSEGGLKTCQVKQS